MVDGGWRKDRCVAGQVIDMATIATDPHESLLN